MEPSLWRQTGKRRAIAKSVISVRKLPRRSPQDEASPECGDVSAGLALAQTREPPERDVDKLDGDSVGAGVNRSRRRMARIPTGTNQARAICQAW